MRRPRTPDRKRGVLALVAALSLWLQVLVPAVGATARLLYAEQHLTAGAVAVVYQTFAVPHVQNRPVLPLGARAPPRFA